MKSRRRRPTTTAKIGEKRAGLRIVSRFPNAVILGRLGAFPFLVGIFLAGAGVLTGLGDALNVRSEVGPGPYFVGQGFELRVGVVAGGQRPKIDPPRIAGARTWTIGTEVRPITASQHRLGRGPRKPVRGPVSRGARASRNAGNPRGPGAAQGPVGSKSGRRACRSRPCRSWAARPSFWGASAGLSFMPRHHRRSYGSARSWNFGSRSPDRRPGA